MHINLANKILIVANNYFLSSLNACFLINNSAKVNLFL